METYLIYHNRMKTSKYLRVGKVPKSIRKIVERGKIATTNTQIHDRSLSWLDTDTSIKSDGVELVLYAPTTPHIPPLSEMMLSCK